MANWACGSRSRGERQQECTRRTQQALEWVEDVVVAIGTWAQPVSVGPSRLGKMGLAVGYVGMHLDLGKSLAWMRWCKQTRRRVDQHGSLQEEEDVEELQGVGGCGAMCESNIVYPTVLTTLGVGWTAASSRGSWAHTRAGGNGPGCRQVALAGIDGHENERTEVDIEELCGGGPTARTTDFQALYPALSTTNTLSTAIGPPQLWGEWAAGGTAGGNPLGHGQVVDVDAVA
ncbi:uncharacterized protein FIBRA_09332 [Fibroporia radiculosa]|uniref:Uncharacterized protein n=1 Tax=Fibroporia radiculosa TaxID=599839 RepID=J7SCY1_9APHY|nr:uncharacterized protein FIBRA_09332 [Fibroporia radiculosa]CCM07013.1 predicted protein [Fibroporia radiculosa]